VLVWCFQVFCTPALESLSITCGRCFSKAAVLKSPCGLVLFLDLMRYAAIAPNVVLVLATRIWANLSEDPAARAAYASSIYVDFSGALFCMSTIFNHIVLAAANQPVRMYGVALPAELASFAELAIDYVLNPGVSILRKASGLLAGLVYVYILPLLSHLLYMVLSK